eukprot:TRINITY_DN1999_c0_g6_i1.p1 TRINITY_DN1999_c0_g6~~TRINITY_DN1999_c0_g6_i1.p1  ORF type:complete len:976 (-),score=173.29 TRINITY_DN1999_c0_g6_i1:35-2962(-)
MGKTSTLTSAGGILALLEEESSNIKVYSLNQLNLIVDEFWAEIADNVDKIEILSEDEGFQNRELAALVASKVFYHLGVFPSSMTYALGAGKLFDVTKKNEYEETLVSKFIDKYTELRVQQTDLKEDVVIDPRLESIVMDMFDRCFNEGAYKQAIGIALESRRLDKFQQAIKLSGDLSGLLAYSFDVCVTITNKGFRQKVYQAIVDLHRSAENPDYVNICQILIFLDDSKSVADILLNLLSSSDIDKHLLALQIAFDIYGNGSQHFLSEVRKLLLSVDKKPSDDSSMDVDVPSPQNIEKLKQILSGEISINLNLEFLCRNNNADLLLLKNIKTAVEARNSVCHSATIFANAIMHAGTTVDKFLRDNLEWLSRATNWAKFSATAGLGVIHKGYLKDAMSLLAAYLPTGALTSPYSEAGALYGLGLIYANHGEEITTYLTKQLESAANNEVLQHGACLGLGLASIASGNQDIYTSIRAIMYSDSAVAGEAAGLSMGLVMLGTASASALDEMLNYAHQTQHEKIIRGLAMGISLIMYGREEEADTLIEQLTLDKDPILRYGGMYTIGLAYCGTANNVAIRRLLHVAVSDVSDDVRRAAVIGLGFVLSRQPKQCPRLVTLLAESYNPHVRYGATLAVGISCAGTALKEAIELLEPMTTDSVDFVRQGALMALAMVLIQTSKAQEPKVEQVRKLFEEKINDKHEETMSKFGAILASGIIDAGGRNVTIALHSRSGHKNMPAIIGLAIFTQFWYWFPFIHFFSLAVTPTAIIGLNSDLKMPKFSVKSNARPSLFAYPPEVKPPTTAAPAKAPTAILSTTRKAKARASSKRLDKSDAMDVDANTPKEKREAKKDDKKAASETPKKTDDSTKKTGTGTTEKEGIGASSPSPAPEKEKEKERKEKEPSFEIKENPTRVTIPQLKHISFDADDRYQPIKQGEVFGIVLLKDTKPGFPEELVTPTTTFSKGASEEKEPDPPEPFEYP